MRGKFITIEGTEGAGKSSAIAWMKAFCKQKQIPVCVTREPGGTIIAEAIRQVLLQTPAGETLYPQAELLLMFASRAQHIKQVIEPALEAGSWVISDRYIDASYAYQGGGRGIEKGIIQFLYEWIVDSVRPDLTLLFDLPVELGLMRAASRGHEKDRIEQEQTAFFERIRQVYLERAAQEPVRINIIDARVDQEAVIAQLAVVMEAFWERHPQ
jgi:dTMP kinase